MKNTKKAVSYLFTIRTGLREANEDDSDDLNWCEYNVLAGSATEAIAKAEKEFDSDEFLTGVSGIAEIHIQ